MTRPRSLRGRGDFRRVYEHGRKLVAPSFVLYALPAPDTATGVVASKRVGHAVQRNRAKRLLRELLGRKILPGGEPAASLLDALARRFPSPDPGEGPGLWIVLVARKAILERGSGELTTELDRILGVASTERPALPGESVGDGGIVPRERKTT